MNKTNYTFPNVAADVFQLVSGAAFGGSILIAGSGYSGIAAGGFAVGAAMYLWAKTVRYTVEDGKIFEARMEEQKNTQEELGVQRKFYENLLEENRNDFSSIIDAERRKRTSVSITVQVWTNQRKQRLEDMIPAGYHDFYRQEKEPISMLEDYIKGLQKV